MEQLTPQETRVLGVLIEKAQTTPAQYPLTLNAIVTGCNQKSNRHPVVDYDEADVENTLNMLRQKQLATEVHMSGSRVPKYRHLAREPWQLSVSEMVVLAELMLRGPQTAGELRSRASRMHPIESMQAVESLLEGLANRQPPLVRSLPPAPGTRARRYAQLLSPLPKEEAAVAGSTAHRTSEQTSEPSGESRSAIEQLTLRVTALEADVAELRQILGQFAALSPAGEGPDVDVSREGQQSS
jgi:hypothetical protein